MKGFPFSQVSAAFTVSIGAFIFGIYLGWSGVSIPILLRDSQLSLSSFKIAWIVSIMNLGESLFCVPAGSIRNRFGTKALIGIYSSASIIGGILLTFAFNSWMLILGRFLCGIAGCGFVFLAPIYIGEISSKEIRGTLASSVDFDTAKLTMIPFIGVIIYLIGFSSGLATVTFVLMSEIFSTSAKKAVAPLALTGTFLSSFIITLAFPLISAHVGMHLMFYFFAFSCIIGIIFTWKFIPETKGKSLSEIQKLLSEPKEINVIN